MAEYRAIHPYTAQLDGDLSFAKGETIVVLECLENGWWRGCYGEKEGWFPGSYLQVRINHEMNCIAWTLI